LQRGRLAGQCATRRARFNAALRQTHHVGSLEVSSTAGAGGVRQQTSSTSPAPRPLPSHAIRTPRGGVPRSNESPRHIPATSAAPRAGRDASLTDPRDGLRASSAKPHRSEERSVRRTRPSERSRRGPPGASAHQSRGNAEDRGAFTVLSAMTKAPLHLPSCQAATASPRELPSHDCDSAGRWIAYGRSAAEEKRHLPGAAATRATRGRVSRRIPLERTARDHRRSSPAS